MSGALAALEQRLDAATERHEALRDLQRQSHKALADVQRQSREDLEAMARQVDEVVATGRLKWTEIAKDVQTLRGELTSLSAAMTEVTNQVAELRSDLRSDLHEMGQCNNQYLDD